MHTELIGPYIKPIRQHHTVGSTTKNDISLTCVEMINPARSWFKIVKVLTFNLDDVTVGNHEYIDKSYARIRQLLNSIWLWIYPCPCKGVFDNGYEFKQEFTPFLKDLDIKPVIVTIKNPQDKSPAERVHQVILNIISIKDLDNKVFKYI